MRAVATRRVEPGAVKHQARFRTAVSTYAPPSIKMAAVTSISRAAMRDSLYTIGFGASGRRWNEPSQRPGAMLERREAAAASGMLWWGRQKPGPLPKGTLAAE